MASRISYYGHLKYRHMIQCHYVKKNLTIGVNDADRPFHAAADKRKETRIRFHGQNGKIFPLVYRCFRKKKEKKY